MVQDGVEVKLARHPETEENPATQDVALQLSKAGVRLAFVLNNALRRQ
jgi:hypothetical protein